MRRLTTPKWLLCHVVMIALVVTFLRLGWWQLTRAEGGNGLSFGYTLEWPAFSAFVIVVWVREVRGVLREEATRRETPDGVTIAQPPAVPANDVVAKARAARAAAIDGASTGSADYNAYLAFLAAHPEARPSDYRAPRSSDVQVEGVSPRE